MESRKAVAMPVTRLVAPGPEVAMTTPGFPVARAQPSAAWAAPCSWAVRTCRSSNSGDYYLKEISVPDSYYLDAEPVPVHLEYKDADTRVISLQYIKENRQTTNEVDKVSAAGSGEIDGCELVITDPEGNEIIRWISGNRDSVKVSETAQGYANLKTSFDENGNLHVGGLFHDTEYTLTETRPADGYATADSIVYML